MSASRRARAKRKPEGENLVERERIEAGVHAGRFKERLDLGGKVKTAVADGMEQRPHPHPVTR
jgi:hypothetical protein